MVVRNALIIAIEMFIVKTLAYDSDFSPITFVVEYLPTSLCFKQILYYVIS